MKGLHVIVRRQSAKLLGFLAFVALISLSSGADAQPRRIALLVDNSGSMYGGGTRRVMPEVRKALTVILEMMTAYNDQRPANDQVELTLMLFGGEHGGEREFQHVALDGPLGDKLKKLTSKLDVTNQYSSTDFHIAFDEAAKVLGAAPATYTVFLTDGVSPAPPANWAIDKEVFGTTYFYRMSTDGRSMAPWVSALWGHEQALQQGWEIIPSFVQIFIKLLTPAEPDRYLAINRVMVEPGSPFVELSKVSDNPARVYLIPHSEHSLRLEGIDHGGRRLPAVENTSRRHLLTLSLPDKSTSGVYRVLLQQPVARQHVSVIKVEDVALRLVDRAHPPKGQQQVHHLNEQVSVHLAFALDSKPEVLLTPKQEAGLLKLAKLGVELVSESPHKSFMLKELSPLRWRSNPLQPGDYRLQGAWNYLEPPTKPYTEIAQFEVSNEHGIKLTLAYKTDRQDEDAKGEDAKGEDAKGEDGKSEDAKGEDAKGEDANFAWEWRDVEISGVFEVNGRAAPEIQSRLVQLKQLPQVKLGYGNAVVTLTRAVKGGPFTATLKELPTGTLRFKAIEPNPEEGAGFFVNNAELMVKPRKLVLHIKKTHRPLGDGPRGLWGELRQGFNHLFGRAQGEDKTESLSLDTFPAEDEVLLSYYDEDHQTLATRMDVQPLFKDETVRFHVEETPSLPHSYDAENASRPWLLGLLAGERGTIPNALTISSLSDREAGTEHTVVIDKTRCDWEIVDPLQPAPLIKFEVSLEQEGREQPRSFDTKPQLSLTFKSRSETTISLLRKSALLALVVIIFALLLIAFLVMVWWRRHRVNKTTLWEEILTLAPEDFADDFPQRPRQWLDAAGKRLSAYDRAGVMRLLRQAEGQRLTRLADEFTFRELKVLKNRCRSPRLSGSWRIPTSAANLIGNGVEGGSTGVRLRDPSLPEQLASLRVRDEQSDVTVELQPGETVAVQYAGDDYAPPHDGVFTLHNGESVLLGTGVGSYRVRMHVSAGSGTLNIQLEAL